MTSVSIVIPCYNHAVYLPDAVNSTLRQTQAPTEIIVVDDGSTDDTRAVAAGFGSKVIYLHQENRGLAAARNAGLAHATGEAESSSTPMTCWSRTTSLPCPPCCGRIPAAAAVYCGFRTVDPDNRPLPQQGLRPLPPSELYAALLDGNFIVPPCMLVRRDSLVAAGGFDVTVIGAEDWDLWLWIARNNRVRSLHHVLVRYRVRLGSMSTEPERMIKGRLQTLAKHVGTDEAPAASRPLARVYWVTSIEAIQSGREQESVDALRVAVRFDPSLLCELETFYELALWDQPKGLRGDFATAPAPAAVEPRLFALLDWLLDDPALSAEAEALRPRAVALAYRALGLICYGRRDLGGARRYFGRSLAAAPGQLADPAVAGVVARSMLPAVLLPRAKEHH